jgi:hypothetical protein
MTKIKNLKQALQDYKKQLKQGKSLAWYCEKRKKSVDDDMLHLLVTVIEGA